MSKRSLLRSRRAFLRPGWSFRTHRGVSECGMDQPSTNAICSQYINTTCARTAVLEFLASGAAGQQVRAGTASQVMRWAWPLVFAAIVWGRPPRERTEARWLSNYRIEWPSSPAPAMESDEELRKHWRSPVRTLSWRRAEPTARGSRIRNSQRGRHRARADTGALRDRVPEWRFHNQLRHTEAKR